MQDLLHGFTDPNVIDIKMGTRTFLESEVTNATARSDLYQKVPTRAFHWIIPESY
jgi:1D-myo-inositol-triphosphate 3-kinase